MIVGILAVMGVANLCLAVFCLSAVGTALNRMQSIADSQATFAAHLTKSVLNKIDEQANEAEWRHSYISSTVSKCAYILTGGDPDYAPLDDPEAPGGVFEHFDDLTGYAGSLWDCPEYKARRAAQSANF
jgi:hypothetical protein